jgi:hypothetical protein
MGPTAKPGPGPRKPPNLMMCLMATNFLWGLDGNPTFGLRIFLWGVTLRMASTSQGGGLLKLSRRRDSGDVEDGVEGGVPGRCARPRKGGFDQLCQIKQTHVVKVRCRQLQPEG